MNDKNAPANADQLRTEAGQPPREHGGTANSPADGVDGRERVKVKAHNGVDTTKQTGTPAKKAATAPAGAAGKAGEKTDDAGATGAVAEKAGLAAQQADAAREKATAVAAQLTEKATQVGQKAGAVAGQVSEKATGIAGELGDKAGVAATQVGVTVIEAVEALPKPVRQRVEQARQHPAVVAAGVAAIALLLWKLVRRGR